MRKQYCLEWYNKSGRDGFKSIGHDCPELAEKELWKKIKSKSCANAYVTWNYTGDDAPEEFEDHFFKGVKKRTLDLLGTTVYIENDYIEY